MKALGWFLYYFTDGRAAGSYLVPVLIWLAVTVRREVVRHFVAFNVKDIRDMNASHA